MNKTDLRDAILAQLRTELAQQTAAAHLARDEAISEESRPENKYDTHSQEAAYLAEGQARLAKEIGESVALYTTLPLPPFASDAAIGLGALIEVVGAKGSSWYFLGPRAGGLEVKLESRSILVVTPQSPLGRELIGKRIGDTIRGPARSGDLRITTVL